VHHIQGITQYQAVSPSHIMLVKLHRLAVFQLGVSKQRALQGLPLRQLEDRLR
jgi:hypothetical protein